MGRAAILLPVTASYPTGEAKPSADR